MKSAAARGRVLLWMPLAAAGVSLALLVWAGYSRLSVAHAHPGSPATVLVYSPHPDDETFAMGGTIASLTRRHRRVVCILVSDGEGSVIAPAWGRLAGRDLDGDRDIDSYDFGLARREEYVHAMRALGVREWVFLGAAASHGHSGNRAGHLRPRTVERSLERVVARYGAAEHMTVMGNVPFDPFLTDLWSSTEHEPVYEAVRALAAKRKEKVTFYKTYVYGLPPQLRCAPTMVTCDAASFAAKKRAIECYSIGRQTTPRIWHAAQADPVEYAVEGDAF